MFLDGDMFSPHLSFSLTLRKTQPQAGGTDFCPAPIHVCLSTVTSSLTAYPLKIAKERSSCPLYGSQVAVGLHWEVASAGRR